MLEIAKSDILARLRFDNPWWDEEQGIVQFQEMPRRKYFASFLEAVQDRSVQRAVVLMGPRRVGKTVMVYHAVRTLLDRGVDPKAILYLSLETPIYTGLVLERLLHYFLEICGHKRDSQLYVFFDEIQYLAQWEIHLKSLVDSYPAYKFVATGSAAAALRLKSNESGAGRFSDFILPPLTFAEYLMFIGREDELIERVQDEREQFRCNDVEALNDEFVRYLNIGGYPESVFSKTIRENPGQYIKSDIIDKVLLRDLPSLYGISDIQELNRLFTTLAYNTGNEVSLEKLSQSSGVAKNTIKRYLEYLEAAFLIRRVERIDQNAKRFQRAMCFKVYLTNPSMRAALFGRVEPESAAMSALTETAIFSQWQHDKDFSLYYARWNSGEIDLVYLDPSNQKPLWAVEVKWSDHPYSNRDELDNCVDFYVKNPSLKNSQSMLHQPFMVTSRTIEDSTVVHRGIAFRFRPSSLYAYELGANLLDKLKLSQ